MARRNQMGNIPVSSFSLSDWIVASVVLTIGASVFVLLYVGLGWMLGMTISPNFLRLAQDIGLPMLLANAVGALFVTAFFWLVRKVRG